MITQKDAELFLRFCNYVWSNKFSFCSVYMEHFFELKGLRSIDFIYLETLGLINRNLTMKFSPNAYKEFTYFGVVYYFRSWEKGEVILEYNQLTTTGEEIYTLCNPNPDKEYIELIKHEYPAFVIIPE